MNNAQRKVVTKQTIRSAYHLLDSCELCPRACNINRLNDEKGFCGTGAKAVVSSAGPHYGEESVLVGNGGSGQYSLRGVISVVFSVKTTISVSCDMGTRSK